MKKTLCLLLAATMLFSLCACGSNVEIIESPEPVYTPPKIAPEDREKKGELEYMGLYVHLYNDLTCELMGTSETATHGTTLEIPEDFDGYTLVKICADAFATSDFTEISLPDSVVEIGDRAFQRCNVREIILPASLEKLGEECFDGCQYLEKLTFQSGVEVIPLDAFYGCRSLKELKLPEGVRVIGEEAFASLKALETLHLPESLEEIGPYAFWNTGCDSIQITVPANVKSVGENAFQYAGSGKISYQGTDETVKAALAAQAELS